MKHYARSRAWCEWLDFEAWYPMALEVLAGWPAPTGTPALPPFHLLSLPGVTALQQRQCADQWMSARLSASAPSRALLTAEFRNTPACRPSASTNKIRLGYLSSDFQQHATALLMVEMLEAHDRNHFELHAYSYGPDNGQGMRRRLQDRFDHFTDITTLDDEQAARAIHADGIDILIDLKGYTAGTRTTLLTYRPAPVQVNFLGYPGTLGGDFCDYLISDRFITPHHSAGGYSEALACLPHSYQPHGRHVVQGAPPTRESVGLPQDGMVFCCFNQSYKFTPEVFDIWCQLLDQTPGSILWLLSNPYAEGNLRMEAMQRGIAPHRLVFARDCPQAEHLSRLRLADLVLDTSPYNAHTTASDALWAGVPILTCAGQTFASRVAGSLLHAVGLPELITHSLVDYAELAMALASDRPRLQALRDKLATLSPDAALFDVSAYTRDLESLFNQMWRRYQAGLLPQALGAG